MSIRKLESEVLLLATELEEHPDLSWFVGTYVSFLEAEKLDYSHDCFSYLPKAKRDAILKKIIKAGISLNDFSTEERLWLAGYYFNNALLRTVSLADIALQLLYKKKEGMDPPTNGFAWLIKWYNKGSNKPINNIDEARKTVNVLKHDLKKRFKTRNVETLDDGEAAFKDLLQILRTLSNSD